MNLTNYLIKLLSFKIVFLFLLPIICLGQQSNNNYSDYINFYQKHISHIRGGECQMYPSCSNFGLDAFREYNPLKAMAKTSDRLLRCSHDIDYYDIIFIDNKFKLSDSIEKNHQLKNEFSTNIKKTTQVIKRENDCNSKFINYLILEKLHHEALLEINREIFVNDKSCEELYINLIKCKRALNEMEDAIFKFENEFPKQLQSNALLNIEIGNCYRDLGENAISRKYYQNIISRSDSSTTNKLQMLMALTFINENNFSKANDYLKKIPPKSPYYYNSQKAILALSNHRSVRYKNPMTAGIYSIIPGLGYLYSGHKSSALSSFLVNGLLFYAVQSNLKSENYGMASLVGIFSLSFYVGNISGSIKSAKRFNEHIDDKTSDKVKSYIFVN